MGFDCLANPSRFAIDCVIQDLFGAVGGQSIFALIVSALLAISFYVASNGGIAVPAVILTLMGSFMLAIIPAQYQSTAQILIFIGLVAAIMALANRYVMQGG